MYRKSTVSYCPYLLAGLLVTLLVTACDSKTTLTSETLRLGVAMQPSNALILLAVEQDYFTDNGLKVETVPFASGKRAFNEGLFQNKVDAITSSVLPFVTASFDRTDFVAIASVFQAANVNRIIARRDAGIERPADLKGKRIATQKNSAVHYFLYLFLLETRIDTSDVDMHFFIAEELPIQLAEKQIDAFSMREPYIGQAQEKLGDNAVVFEAPGVFSQSELLVISQAVLKQKPALAPKLLKSLLQAEDFVRNHPKKATAMIAKRLNASPEQVAEALQGSLSRVNLGQSLLLEMEDQARWVQQILQPQTVDIPNYLDFINPAPLTQVEPNAVSLVQ